MKEEMKNLLYINSFLSQEKLAEYLSQRPTPYYLYDEETIRKTCQDFKSAFSLIPGFTNYFAVKATPNPHILKIMKEEEFGVDCSSLAELVLAKSVGFRGEEIFFTSNNTPLSDFVEAKELGAILNLDDISHVDFVHENIGLPNLICLRYNPGMLRIMGGNDIIGNPKDAKFGMTRDQIFLAFEMCKNRGVKRFALHTMVISNCLDELEFVKTAKMMFDLVSEINDKLGIKIEILNLGGGIGIPYKPEDNPFNLKKVSKLIRKEYDVTIESKGLGPLKIVFECGRFITGPSGVLVTRIVHIKNTHKKYIGVDACMANLMRPALYNAYHHMVLVKNSKFSALACESNFYRKCNFINEEAIRSSAAGICDVVGSLCENNDKLAVDRYLGTDDPEIGDLLIIYDTGAHGHSMGFNYNGKLRCAEYMRNMSGEIQEIRRAETLADLFATLSYWSFSTENAAFG